MWKVFNCCILNIGLFFQRFTAGNSSTVHIFYLPWNRKINSGNLTYICLRYTEMWDRTKMQPGSKCPKSASETFASLHRQLIMVCTTKNLLSTPGFNTALMSYGRSTYMPPDGWWERQCACSWQHLVSLDEGAAGTWAAPAAWEWEDWSGRWCTRHGTGHSQVPRTRPCRAGAAEGPSCLPHTKERRSGKMKVWQTANTDPTAGWTCQSW